MNHPERISANSSKPPTLEAGRMGEKEILEGFSDTERADILYKKRVLSSLGYFIGKDFNIPIMLNEPGAGWHWNFKRNIIRIDPKILLERSLDELRYFMCHEGGHRRISRYDFIPVEVWQQPGFALLSNFIEDPRNDNFVSESYPTYRANVDAVWNTFFDNEKKSLKEKAEHSLGTKPRYVRAGFEYIRQWFNEIHDQTADIDPDLPEEVKTAVKATIEAARDAWWRYPTRAEADRSEELISQYAQRSYEIIRDKIWPEFKKLVDADIEDQKAQELLKDAQRKQGGDGAEQGLPQDLMDTMTPEEQEALEKAIKEAIQRAIDDTGDEHPGENEQSTGELTREDAEKKDENAVGEQGEKTGEGAEETENGEPTEQKGGEPKPVNLDSLPEGVKQKIKDYIDSLPEEQQKKLIEKARENLKKFEDAINEEKQGKLSENPEQRVKREQKEVEEGQPTETPGGEPVHKEFLAERTQLYDLRAYKERLSREVNKDENVYEGYRRDLLPLIESLEAELRQILVDRKVTSWQGGFRFGKRIDIKTRIQEKARQIPAMESEAWQKRERPDEKEYAISLLNDLSGSMRGATITEDFKTKVVLAEAINKLGINVEIMGFNDEMYEYQNFGEPMTKEVREHMGGMFKEVEDSCCKGCGNEHSETDLGWAIQTADERLQRQKATRKLLIVLTDGRHAESSKHPSDEFDADRIKQEIIDRADAVLIDIGSIRGKSVTEIIEELKERIKQSL